MKYKFIAPAILLLSLFSCDENTNPNTAPTTPISTTPIDFSTYTNEEKVTYALNRLDAYKNDEVSKQSGETEILSSYYNGQMQIYGKDTAEATLYSYNDSYLITRDGSVQVGADTDTDKTVQTYTSQTFNVDGTCYMFMDYSGGTKTKVSQDVTLSSTSLSIVPDLIDSLNSLYDSLIELEDNADLEGMEIKVNIEMEDAGNFYFKWSS